MSIDRYGIDFVILDKNATTTPHSKAIGVQARTLEIYEQMDIAADLIANGALPKKCVCRPAGKCAVRSELNDIGEGISPFPFLLIVEQSCTNMCSHDFIKSGGRDVLWNTRLESFTQDDSGVSAIIKTADGE